MTDLVAPEPPAELASNGARLDHELRHCARRLAIEWLAFARLARSMLDGGYWSQWAATPEEYFQGRCGLSYRTVRRWLSVEAALRAVPETEQPFVQETLLDIGGRKASILAPIIERDRAAWSTWVAAAQELTEERLQARVSSRLGLRPRGSTGEPGERWYRQLLSGLPDSLQAPTQRAFALAARASDSRHPIVQFAALVHEFLGTWEPRVGRTMPLPPDVEP